MAVRSVHVLLATAGFVTSVSAIAVGLGEIRLQSTINQPLAAEIELLSVEGRESGQIRARLGSPEDFERAGLERPFALTGLAFRPVLDAAGGPVLKVTSAQSIREPFLDFLVRLEWPDGQLLRAYTVLLDLPEQGVQPPLARRSGPATFEADPAESRPQPRSLGVSPLRRPAIAPGSGSYTVRSGDTLWSVASRARPQGATVQQTLMAIYRENPEAFIDGDMNRMRRDYALRVPEPTEVAAIDADDARATVWRETGEGLSTALLPVATVAPSPSTDAGAMSGQLRLAAPRLDAPSGSVMASSDATESAAAPHATGSAVGVGNASLEAGRETDLEKSAEGGSEPSSGDIAAASGAALNASAAEKILYLEEEVQLTRRENRELHERIDNLEEQLGVMSRLVELQSDTVATSQLPEPVRVEEAMTEPAQATAESGLFSKAWLALGGLAVLLLGGMVVRKRRHQQGDEPAAPELFMTHTDTGSPDQESAADAVEDGVAAGDETRADALDETFAGPGAIQSGEHSPWATGSDDETEREASDPFAAFAVSDESQEQTFAALIAAEGGESGKPLEESADAEPGAETGAQTEADTDAEVPLDSVAETELEFDLDLNSDLDLDLDLDLGSDLDQMELDRVDLDRDLREEWSDLNPSSLEEDGATAADPLAALEADLETDLNVEESGETSLEKWFAELAEEPATGQNNGVGVVGTAGDVSESDGAVVVSSSDDYRVATTFDLDFAAFAEEGEAMTQRDPFQTRLELARVYIDMQDSQSAREILEELTAAANEDVQRDARELLHSLG